ncbi:MAG: hypothetical protein E6H58_21050 [Betaproteobacteria bacterium]|nr:MAG: hypothetical protein E6H58_21050 [Betaproteobacteria bacterium]
MNFFYSRTKDGAGSALPVAPQPATEKATRSSEPADAEDDEVSRGWLASSLELKHGLEVHEEDDTTIPGELLDAFSSSGKP